MILSPSERAERRERESTRLRNVGSTDESERASKQPSEADRPLLASGVRQPLLTRCVPLSLFLSTVPSHSPIPFNHIQISETSILKSLLDSIPPLPPLSRRSVLSLLNNIRLHEVQVLIGGLSSLLDRCARSGGSGGVNGGGVAVGRVWAGGSERRRSERRDMERVVITKGRRRKRVSDELGDERPRVLGSAFRVRPPLQPKRSNGADIHTDSSPC